MKVAFFSTQSYDRIFFDQANSARAHELVYFETRLKEKTVPLTQGFDAVCVFVNDELNERVVSQLSRFGVRLVALRSAGFNNVDLCAAGVHHLTVARVPGYSPYSVAEHAVGLLLGLNRRLYRAYNRVREGNFTLDGLLGFEVRGRRVAVIGTGRIGEHFARLMLAFGCEVVAFDPYPKEALVAAGVKYLSLSESLGGSDIVSLHVPLTHVTHHLINGESLKSMKRGVMILNTSRGALIDTVAVIKGLKSGQVGALGLDVYEEESHLFFKDLSSTVIQDDVFSRLLTFPNVLVTAHQGFFTDTAMNQIAAATLANITDFGRGSLIVANQLVCGHSEHSSGSVRLN